MLIQLDAINKNKTKRQLDSSVYIAFSYTKRPREVVVPVFYLIYLSLSSLSFIIILNLCLISFMTWRRRKTTTKKTATGFVRLHCLHLHERTRRNFTQTDSFKKRGVGGQNFDSKDLTRRLSSARVAEQSFMSSRTPAAATLPLARPKSPATRGRNEVSLNWLSDNIQNLSIWERAPSWSGRDSPRNYVYFRG